MDFDRDGKITRRELESYIEEQSGEMPDAALFLSEDVDGNGYVSWDEFSGPKGTAPPDYNAPEFQAPVRTIRHLDSASFFLVDNDSTFRCFCTGSSVA